MLGFLLIDKPPGITSHDVIYQVRRALREKRVGHAGTLDPMATGLLVVGVNAATRLFQYLQLEPKVYEGSIRFGIETNTQDADGEVVNTTDAARLTIEQVRKACSKLVGETEQMPPMFSAVKVDGRPLYHLARKGIEVERKTRTITVEKFEILSMLNESAEFQVICSGGTYVRTLAHDVGRTLGVGAHLTRLRRTRIGNFDVSMCCTIEEIQLIPPESALQPMPTIIVDKETSEKIYIGQRIILPTTEKRVAVMHADSFLAICEKEGDEYQPVCVMPRLAC